MLNKRNINSVCLLRKDLLSDKVSTKGPPDFENHSPHRLFHRPLPVLMPATQIMCMYTYRMCTDSQHTHTHSHTKKKKLFKSHLNKVH